MSSILDFLPNTGRNGKRQLGSKENEPTGMRHLSHRAFGITSILRISNFRLVRRQNVVPLRSRNPVTVSSGSHRLTSAATFFLAFSELGWPDGIHTGPVIFAFERSRPWFQRLQFQ